jgi:hypothetical protein
MKAALSRQPRQVDPQIARRALFDSPNPVECVRDVAESPIRVL